MCLSTLPPDSGTLISKWNAKFTFIWKENFGPLSNSPVLFLHSPGKMLLTLSLVQKWLGSPFPEDVWAWWLLMHWLQLQSTPCEALPSVWISFAWLYSQAWCHPCCLCTFSYPNSSFQSTLHLICFDKALCKQPHLSVMTFCDLPSLWRVSMFFFSWNFFHDILIYWDAPVYTCPLPGRFITFSVDNYCPDGANVNFHCSSSFLKATSLICEAQLSFNAHQKYILWFFSLWWMIKGIWALFSLLFIFLWNRKPWLDTFMFIITLECSKL